jgi:autotransporter-associated beta strand protein
MRTKLLSILAILASAATAFAATELTWDPNQTDGATPGGGGNWDTNTANTFWYNGTSDVAWTQTSTTSPTQGAIFGGSGGTVNLDEVQVAVTNLQINSSGYTFTGTNALYIGSDDFLNIANSTSVAFNCNVGGSGTEPCWVLGTGATMNIGGNLNGTQQVRVCGPAGSAVNLTGNDNVPGIMFILAPVNVNSASLIPNSSFYIGYTQTLPAPNSTTYNTGVLTINGSSTFQVNGNILIIGRSSGSGTLTVNGGMATIGNTTATRSLAIDYDGSASSSGTVNVTGGTLTVGSSAQTGNEIAFFYSGASSSSATATLSETGGLINTWGGIVFGSGGGSGTASLSMTGGSLNVGASGITKGGSYTGSMSITLSGGTVGDLTTPGWSSSLPMTLGTTNGNVTFGPTYTITLSGPVTGSGGLFVNNGTLALTGADNFSGGSAVSNGTLSVSTASSPTSGALTLDASFGSPTVSVTSTPGDAWSIGGSLTFQNGTGTLGYQFGSLPPSPSVAPVHVSGGVSFASTPNVSISGTEIAKGTYPLITYTGTVSGTLPTVTSWSGSATAGTLTNNTSTKTISLIVTGSSVTAPLTWAVASSTWDFTSANWKQNSAPADYTDGDAVIFDDTASGTSPITVTLNNTTVNPASVTFNNNSKSYVVAGVGSGEISGSATLSALGSGTSTLAGYNNYSGGTTLGAGQLNINVGGDFAGSAIGTGTLTINGGAIDNTSGSNVTLGPSIPETWNNNFTYVGSSNSFNTGSGEVTLGANVTVNVASNGLTVGGEITDNFEGLGVTKSGNGTLTLNGNNNFGGPLTLNAGKINFGSPYAAGGANFIINASSACQIDNTSGGPMTMSQTEYTWTTGFEFIGTSSLDLGSGTVFGTTDPNPITIQVDTNTLTTEGELDFGNVTVNKSGPGTWVIAGFNGDALNLVIEAGVVQFNKTTNQAVSGTKGLTIETGALAQDEQNYQMHSDTAGSPETVSLAGGTWDLNGNTENVDILAFSIGGTLENSAAGTSVVNNISHLTNTLSGLSYFEVDQSTGVLSVNGVTKGDGTETLVKTGLGTLILLTNEIYTGPTVISNGTIALVTNGALSSSVINLATANSALDLTSNVSTTLTLANGQTLSGFGVVTGLVVSVSGSTVSPGSASTIGTLTATGFSGASSLNGTTVMKLNKAGATNDVLAVGGSLSFGGALSLSNLGGTLAAGDTFKLFYASSYSGAFASISPSSPGAGLAWDTSQLDTSGTIGVATGSTLRPAVFTPIAVSGTRLTLSGTNGTVDGTYHVLTTTNLSVPVTNWAVVGSGSFDGSGNFSFNVTNTNNTAQFYILKEP